MILSRGRRYVFVHQPKTGGTSMALALEGRAMKDDLMLGDTPKALKRRKRLKQAQARGRLWKHSTLADIDGLVTPEELDGLFCFTIVRNPWDRMVSYYHWLKGQRFAHPAVELAKDRSFEEFVCHPQTEASWRVSPARHYMTDAAGHERADLFLRLEHLQEDATPLWDHLGFALEIPHENQSERERGYQSYFSHAARESVGSMAAEDIERFGYTFD